MLFPTVAPLAMGRMWLLWYCLLPVVSACVWLGTCPLVYHNTIRDHIPLRFLTLWLTVQNRAAMLMGMLIEWQAEGSPHYSSMAQNQSIAYGPP